MIETAGGLLFLALAVANTAALGAVLRRWVGMEVTRAILADLTIGGMALFLVAGCLGAAGLYRWPILLGLVLFPTPLAVRRWREIRRCLIGWRPRPIHVVVALPLGLAIAQAVAPAVHFDLLVNYIGVARDDLIQGHLGRQPHNIHAALSLPLHVLGAFILALGEPLNRSPFPFGTAPLWGMVIGATIATSLWFLRQLAGEFGDATTARWSTLLAGSLWLTTPQTLLLAHLQSAEFLVTGLALGVAVMALTVRRSAAGGDGLVLGLLAGCLVASKPQWAVLAVAAVAVGWWRRPLRSAWKTLAGLAIAPICTAVRAAIVYGNPLFPWVDDGNAAAMALKAENAVALADGMVAFVQRLVELLTLQPEGGLIFGIIAIGLFGRRHPWPLWLLGGLPLASLIAVTGNTVNTLRWAQPALPLLLLASLIGLHHRFARPTSTLGFRWAVGGAAVAGLILALRFTSGLHVLLPQWRDNRTAYLEDRIPRFAARLTPLPGRTLVLGEIIGFYGPAEAVFPAPQNGRWASVAVSDGSMNHLWIAPEGLQRLRGMPTWEWLDSEGMDTLRRAAASSDRRDLPGVIVCPAPR